MSPQSQTQDSRDFSRERSAQSSLLLDLGHIPASEIWPPAVDRRVAQRNMSAELMRNSREIAEAISINCAVPGCAGLCGLSEVSAAFYDMIVYYTGAVIHVLTVDWIVII